MIGTIIDMLDVDAYYGMTEEIEIAKGRDKLQTDFRGAWEQRKRKKKWHRK